MKKFCITLFVIAGVGWYIQNTVDFAKVKEDTMGVLRQEKTINTVNSKRNFDQDNIYKATNR
ncbi:hypothetical protein IJ425_07595 [bacterium]|nr:hypothetical protein [bacterium]